MPGYRKDAAMVQNQGMGTNPAQPQPQYSQPQNYQPAQPQNDQPVQPRYEQAQNAQTQPRYEQPQNPQSLFSVPEPDLGFDAGSFYSIDKSADNFFDDL
jgi:hypothetical protein